MLYHTTGAVRLLLFTNNSVDSFTSSKNQNNEELWDGAFGCSSLFEKSRMSNHL